ncbi:MAG: GerMN domain-containing protein [Pyrinomonadaceae bacterium]
MRATNLFLLTALVLACAFTAAAQSKSGTMTVKVFFHDDKRDPEVLDCNKAAPTTRTIPKTAAVATAALLELFKGPLPEEAKDFSGFGPPETDGILKNVNVKNGAAYVNFTGRLTEQMGNATSSCGSSFFAMIDSTLMQFPTVKKVVYAVEGDTNEFYEWAQVGECPHGRKHCARRNFK